MRDLPQTTIPVPAPRVNEKFRNDSQNVHDSSVSRAMSNSINNLIRSSTSTAKIGTPEQLKDLRDYIKNVEGISPEKKMNAIKTLDECEKNIVPLSQTHTTESDTLALVWTRIHHPDNKDRCTDLKNNLIYQMDSAVEGKMPVCATGRVARILGTLERTDADENLVSLRPKWALKEELSNMVLSTREKALKDAPHNVRQAYEEAKPTTEQQDISNRFISGIRNTITENCQNAYVKTGLIKNEEIKMELDPLLDAL